MKCFDHQHCLSSSFWVAFYKLISFDIRNNSSAPLPPSWIRMFMTWHVKIFTILLTFCSIYMDNGGKNCVNSKSYIICVNIKSYHLHYIGWDMILLKLRDNKLLRAWMKMSMTLSIFPRHYRHFHNTLSIFYSVYMDNRWNDILPLDIMWTLKVMSIVWILKVIIVFLILSETWHYWSQELSSYMHELMKMFTTLLIFSRH